jgi:hypothetical protein
MLKVVSSEDDGADSVQASSPVQELVVSELSSREEKLIKSLRKEANAANDTFTKYVFQTLSISGVALGAIIEFMFFLPIASNGDAAQLHPLLPLVGLAAFPILIFALAVCRIGTYYYTDSNRQFGFELFLSRVRLAPTDLSGRWKNEFKQVDWEEAMRAWRVVQETLFHKIHPRESLLFRHKYAKGFAPDPKTNPMWFCQTSLFGESSKAVWKAGKYLDTMQLLLLFVAFVASFILWLVPVMTTIPTTTESASFTIATTLPIAAKDASRTLKTVLPISTKDATRALATPLPIATKNASHTLIEAIPIQPKEPPHTLIFYVINKDEWTQHLSEYSWLSILMVGFLISAAVRFDYRREHSSVRSLSGLIATGFLAGMFAILLGGAGNLRVYDLFNLKQWDNQNFTGSLLAVMTIFTAAFSTLATWLSARNERARRVMLKDGILSLHSCAIVWEAVVVAHFTAIERARHCKTSSWKLARLASPSLRGRLFGPVPAAMWTAWQNGDLKFEKIVKILQPEPDPAAVDGAGMPGYTFWLGQEAVSLARWARYVPSWIGLGEEELKRRGLSPKAEGEPLHT